MTGAGTVDRGREAFARRMWSEAHALLAAADEDDALAAEDLERLATASCLIGRDPDSTDAWARAHQAFLDRGEVERAVRCAFWLAFRLLQKGEAARGGGWVARGRRLLDDADRDCVERGYLLFPVALKSIFSGDDEAAEAAFRQAVEIGERYDDADLIALARHGRGRALIRMGEVEAGVALLDEAMAAVEAGVCSPIVVGDVYCSLIEACHEIFDLRRATEWTAALSGWCESQPDLVPYRGPCLVRRAEILQMKGAWPDAMQEAEQACEWLSRPPGERAAGAAFYQTAEIHRLRGEFAEAEEAYREANRWGRKPQPGLALLRLAQGRVEAAAAAIRRVVEEAQERRARARVLSACTEIMLAADDLESARAAANELAGIAEQLDAPVLRAAAASARGSVLLGEGDARSAMEPLRRASAAFEEMEVPYEAARVRVLIGLACRELGDDDTAELEFSSARWVFERLGATPDVARIEELAQRPASGPAHGLTPREVQVLRRVATGRTNKAIAGDLFISERTVERHVSNIFGKIHVSSRAAATAWAYEHELV